MKDETNHIFFKQLWVDRGGNVGVECDRCGNTIWGAHSIPREIPIDPQHLEKGLMPCPNCITLQKSNFVQTETERHQREIEAYNRKLFLASNDFDRQSITFDCTHKPSQRS
jgi:hypothetical protein